MSNLTKRVVSRARGSAIAVFVVGLAGLVILPLALYSFEISRIHLAQNQLRAATDAAALAAGQVIIKSGDQATPSSSDLALAASAGLKLLQRNFVLDYALAGAQMAAGVGNAQPAESRTLVEFTYDQTKKQVTAHGVIGVVPAFGKFLGIGSVPIYAESTASCGSSLEGDITFVVDISNSMTTTSKTIKVDRQWSDDDGRFHYSLIGPSNNPCCFPHKNTKFLPDIHHVEFAKYDKLRNVPNSDELRMAALCEARLGNLENRAIFEESKANRFLADYITPAPGFQDLYQEIALSTAQPLFDEKMAISDFVVRVGQSEDVHFGLVTYGPQAAKEGNVNPTYATRTKFELPYLGLDRSKGQKDELLAALMPCTHFWGTNTAAGMRRGIDMLEGPGHRLGKAKTLILLTDGMPTCPLGSCLKAGREAGRNGINLIAIGFFHSKQSINKGGPKVVKAIAQAAGGTSYVAQDPISLQKILQKIASGEVRLVNRG